MQRFKQVQLIHMLGYLATAFLIVYGAIALIQDTFWLGTGSSALAAPAQLESPAVIAASLQQAGASVPQLLTYSGELRNENGGGVSGIYTMTFRIYDNQEAEQSAALWWETRHDVRVQNGRFGLVLGESNPISPSIFSGPARYIGFTVESQDGSSLIREDTPELGKLTAMVPFAADPDNASALMDSNGDPLDSMYINSAGNVGIGTTEPLHRLSIFGGPRWTSNGWHGAIELANVSAIGWRANPSSLAFGMGYSDTGFAMFRTVSELGSDSSEAIYDLVINNSGNVGLGTNNPSSQLDVNGTTTTRDIDVTEGGDLAEHFEIDSVSTIEPGTVVSIDPDQPGKLRVADQPYDRMVAGVVSGAGGLEPGIVLHQGGSVGMGNHPVALAGRVYVLADASYGAILPGDLLTTSDHAGHAMKVVDHERAWGAILGKAMSALSGGSGLVLVLVSLQ